MPQDRNFTDDVVINKNALDEEWLKQATIYQYWAEQLELLNARMAELDNDLDLFVAQTDSEIRTNPASFDLPEKITEAAIKNCIITLEAFQTRKQAILSIQKQIGIMKVGVQAIQQKKVALENLVQLYLSGYWSTPRAPEGDTRNWTADARTASEEAGRAAHEIQLNNSRAGRRRRPGGTPNG